MHVSYKKVEFSYSEYFHGEFFEQAFEESAQLCLTKLTWHRVWKPRDVINVEVLEEEVECVFVAYTTAYEPTGL